MTWQYLHKNTENINVKFTCLILISFNFWTQLIQKQTNLSSNMGQVWLDFSVVKCTVTVGMQIYWFSKNIDSAYEKIIKLRLKSCISRVTFGSC